MNLIRNTLLSLLLLNVATNAQDTNGPIIITSIEVQPEFPADAPEATNVVPVSYIRIKSSDGRVFIASNAVPTKGLPPSPDIVLEPRNRLVKWHWRKECSECGEFCQGVERISGYHPEGGTNFMDIQVSFDCPCGFKFSETTKKPLRQVAPMRKVAE